VATIYDVAKRAGVSVGTVSNVINNKRTVNPALRSKVKEAMKEIGYVPNATARSLARGYNTSIGVLYPFNPNHVAGTSYLDFVSHLITYAQLFQHQVVLYPSTKPSSNIDDLQAIVRSRQVGSYILFEVEMEDRRVEYLRENGLPFVMVGRTADCSGLAYVDADVAQIVRDGLEHLWEMGCRRIAHLGRSGSIGVDARIRAALADECSRLGLELNPELCCVTDWDPEKRLTVVEHFIQRRRQFDAVFISEAAVRFQFVQEVLRAGLRIPEDFMVLGYMGTSLDEMSHPSITAFDVQADRIVELAVATLLAKDNPSPGQVLVPGKLVVRESTEKRNAYDDRLQT
jgi:DNA-binding LacI/PurR family transcriptional regulator